MVSPRVNHLVKSVQRALTHLKTDWINFGRIMKLYMIFELNWKEPEVVLKYRVRCY